MIYDREGLINYIEGSIDKFGRLPTEKELIDNKFITWRCARDFGGYSKLIENLGFEYVRTCKFGMMHNLTDNEIVTIFNSHYVDETPLLKKIHSDYKEGSFPISKDAILHRYKNYKSFLEMCGREKPKVSLRKTDEELKYKRPSQCVKYVEYSKCEVVTTLKLALENEGDVSYEKISELYNSKKLPFGINTIRKYFNSIGDAMFSIGRMDLIKINRNKYFSKEDMIRIFTSEYDSLPSQLEVEDDFKCKLIPFNVIDICKNFGSYSNFAIECSYDYIKGKYSQKYKSSDGTICDSKKELMIDEFLNKNKIPHTHHVFYKDLISGVKGSSKCDFLLSDNTIVEYFGLHGVKRYDEKVSKKIKLLEDNNMKYIVIYPRDISRLDEIFKDYIKEVV